MSSLESFGVDEYGNGNGVNLPDFTGCLLLATTPTPPAGTLVADGSEVSREAYAKLFAIFGESHGAGDGVTTFNLPDWRDEFPRFNGTSRTVGSKQTDAIRNITGSLLSVLSDDNGTTDGGATGVFTWYLARDNVNTPGGNCHSNHLDFSAANVVPTADENRPRNVAFLPCVIYV